MVAIKKYLEDLAWLKRLVFFSLVLSFVYIIFFFFFIPVRISNIKFNGQSEKNGEFRNIVLSSSRDCSTLVGSLSQRQIFAPLYQEEKPANSANTDEAIKNLKLVGIISTDPPRVVINDQKDNQTYYLEEGEAISDSVRVVEIRKDSVIIDYYGERFEFFL